jgi:hypothetical protein
VSDTHTHIERTYILRPEPRVLHVDGAISVSHKYMSLSERKKQRQALNARKDHGKTANVQISRLLPMFIQEVKGIKACS